MELNTLTIAEARDGIMKKEFSPQELFFACREAIQRQNPALNAYLDVYDDVYDAVPDEKTKKHTDTLPGLYGIPLAVKDNILIRGRRATAGSNILKNYTAPYDATVIKRLRERGALFLGKTNLDEFAMGSSTEHSAFGPTRNPHDTARVAGGSSGGSAAAVAGHLCLGALGSDTGGSIRQPASFCGVVGMKPTYGRVSRFGLIAMASSLDQIGPIAKTVEDAHILYAAIAGKDPLDATTADPHPAQNRKQNEIKNLRIGIPKEHFGRGLDAMVEKTIKNVIEKAERAGAHIKEISLPHSEYALPTYYIIMPSEVSSNLARFDGIRYGTAAKTAKTKTLEESYAETRAAGFGQEVKRRILLGTYTLSAGYYDAYYVKAQKVRRLIRRDFEAAFRDVDVILGPTTPTPAFPVGDKKAEDPIEMYLSDIYTVSINLAGLPSLSLPAGAVQKEGATLPVGVQLTGPWFDEERLFGIAKNIETLLAS